jgi:hypothetical protein
VQESHVEDLAKSSQGQEEFHIQATVEFLEDNAPALFQDRGIHGTSSKSVVEDEFHIVALPPSFIIKVTYT